MTYTLPSVPERRWRRISHHRRNAPTLDHRRALAVPLTASGAPARGTTRAVSVFNWRPVFDLGTRHEVTACVGMRRSRAALGGAVLCTTRCRQRAGRRRGGRRDRWDCRRWPRRRNGGDRRRLGRRRDRRVQPAPELRLSLPRLCRAWRLPLDTGALQPLGRMAPGPLRTVLEGCFKRSAVSCNCPKSATIVTTVTASGA